MIGGFTWGEGGVAASPEDAKRKREMYANMIKNGTTGKPIQHWTQGAADLAEALIGGYKLSQLDKAEKDAQGKADTQSKGMIGSLSGGDQPQAQSQPQISPAPVAGQVVGTGAGIGAGGIRSGGQGSAIKPSGDISNVFLDTARSGGLNNPAALAALGATGERESGWSATKSNATWADPSERGQAGTSGGALSWRAERLANLQNFAKQNGEQGNGSPATQAKFFLQENPALVQQLNSAKTPQEAMSLMNNAWKFAGYNREGGEKAERMQAAERWAGRVGQAPQQQVAQATPQAQAQPQQGQAQIEAAMQVMNNPWARPADKFTAQMILQKRLTQETKDPRDSTLKDLSIAEKQGAIQQQTQMNPLAVQEKQLGIQKTQRELAGEGATPLSAEERKSIGVPDGQPAYKTRNGEIKFGPAGTKVSVDASQKTESEFGKETGKALAKRFDQLATDGDEAAQSMELVAEMRRLGGNIQTGAGATVKAYLGKVGVKTDGISDIEAFQTLIDRLTPQQRVPGSGATSDFDAKMFKGSLPSLMNTPEGNQKILETVERISANKIARGDVAMRVQMQEMTPKEGLSEIRKLQAEAKAISDQFKPTGKPSVSAAPSQLQSPKRPISADPLGIFQ